MSRETYTNRCPHAPLHPLPYLSECEGLWLGRDSDIVIRPGMQFNIDVWLSDGEYGVRYEDGILVTEDGIEELNSYRREIIIL